MFIPESLVTDTGYVLLGFLLIRTRWLLEVESERYSFDEDAKKPFDTIESLPTSPSDCCKKINAVKSKNYAWAGD